MLREVAKTDPGASGRQWHHLYFGCRRDDATATFAVVVDNGGFVMAGQLFDALWPDIVQKAGMKEIEDDVFVPEDCMKVAFLESDLYTRVPELAAV